MDKNYKKKVSITLNKCYKIIFQEEIVRNSEIIKKLKQMENLSF